MQQSASMHTSTTQLSPRPHGGYRNQALHASMPGHRSRMMGENQRRVQRQKLEKKFMAEVSKGRNYSLGDYRKLEEEHQERGAVHRAVDAPAPKERRDRGPGPPISIRHEFTGAVRCLEVTQGGTTLWTGDMDGTTSIRNGSTGEVVHHIRGQEGLYVDSLMASDTHMWVGCSDGTVRIYDHLVYILVSETKYHEDSVSCFAATFDGKVFSASLDTTIVKWDTEMHGFEFLAKLNSSSPQAIHAIVCYGYNLFVGSDDGQIRCLDTESVQLLRTFTGHTDGIRSLLVQDGYLFSGAKDGKVRAWNMEHGEQLLVLGEIDGSGHTCGITALAGDPVAHAFWSADEQGHIKVWDSRPSHDFRLVCALEGHHSPQSPSQIVVLKTLCTVDAVKLWSLAANGRNCVWYSEVNRMEDSVQAAADAMESIINQDLVELAKWKELIRKLEAIDDRRKNELGSALGRVTAHGLGVTYLHKLSRHLAVKRARRRIALAVSGREVYTATSLRARYWRKLQLLRQVAKRERRGAAVRDVLLQQTSRGLQALYWRRCVAYAAREKRARLREEAALGLAGRSTRAMRRAVYSRLARLSTVSARKRKRRQVAESLLCLTDRGRRSVYWVRLRDYALHCRHLRQRRHIARCVGGVSSQGLRVRCYRLWLKWANKCKARQALGLAMGEFSETAFMHRYWDYWRQHQAANATSSLRNRLAEDEAENRRLQALYEQREATLSRLKQVTAAEAQRDARLADRDQALELLAARRADLDAAKARLRAKQEMQQRKDQLSARQKAALVADVMAVLKAKALNYSFDFKLIEKTRDAALREEGGARKAFLKGHIGVKRVVREVSKCEQQPGERWRNLDGHIDHIPEHHRMSILQQVKIMCIAYDLMSEQEKEGLETDDEIIANDDPKDGQMQYLSYMVDQGRKLEDKRRRR
eukprot:TRINITY_DN21553_c0_g1_i2.p1 TRINITY_DN21553_c0_g1~~TRINITY_DN21553_c0_g1_i2.p1  ORF type:complete len:964 (+),score=341.46 TRINITY_DN21553_c0_g1_i2:114-2894(+)